MCRNVFSKSKVVNNYIQELKPSVREYISQSVRILRDSDKNILAVVSQATVPQGKAQSLLLDEFESKAVTTVNKAPETKKAVKYARMSTLINPPSPTWADEEASYMPVVGFRTDKEALRVARD